MRKYLSFIISGILFCVSVGLNAQDLLPSDSYYKDNIAVNEVHAEAPSLKAPGGEDGGPGDGGGEWGGGGWVGSPVGDAILPIIAAGIAYASFLLLRRRRSAI
ncbi:hypothetical protein CLV62_1484 [Dysgonomonas alginatilytica]|uniref:MYXO-CTERM domain-containing protein n=1 Tax=Dysgonomonas alginatilytica TaxID=1605892 RepID=A0A2V3PKB6_9BACT|nr:hypothetical protein [Dysgonomonas alginatilytica]PXV58419.1 hypothetical protein CLV62_1484 [Dysgonomonas alginatilytica]